MSGQPPVMPPSLSYKSKAQREQDERERKEREEAERLAQEQYEARMAEVRKQEEAERKRSLLAPPKASQPSPIPPPASSTPPPAASPPPDAAPTPQPTTAPARDEGPRPSIQDPKSLVMFNEDGVTPLRREIDDIEMLGSSEEKVEEEVEEEEEEKEAKKRFPPRPPKSPDMRPVAVGFILVFTGLTQFIYGVWTMLHSPDAASGPWSPIVQWGTFSMGFSAAFLGLLAIRGGLWSFRKERFSVVKAGAIAATVCVWAWWIPWLFGLAALLIATRSREEYYPFYNPQWDAPEFARPPPKAEDEEEVLDQADSGDDASEDQTREPGTRDNLDDVSPGDTGEGTGHQDIVRGDGDGWEDID